jgi:DNA-directed RNA polymerase subunit E'/Rpb7
MYNTDMRTNDKEKGMKMKIGDFVFAEYDNGEIVNGEVVNVRNFGERVLLTVKAEQGYRSIYLDKCITFDHMQAAN